MAENNIAFRSQAATVRQMWHDVERRAATHGRRLRLPAWGRSAAPRREPAWVRRAFQARAGCKPPGTTVFPRFLILARNQSMHSTLSPLRRGASLAAGGGFIR